MQRHNIVISKGDGGVEVYPMKQWLRAHPEHLPPGIDQATSTSHQLRNILRRRGWTLREAPHEISLFPPDTVSSEIEEVAGPQSDEEAEGDFDEIAFELEHQLRDFIATNLNSIDVNGKRLRLYLDPTGRKGIEYPTGVGNVDLLATDDKGAFFVFELKRASSPDRAIGQVARYMGWVRHTIAKGQAVSGVIVAKAITEKLRYAASVVPNIHLFEYEVGFHLKKAQLEV
jgi:endonuclease